MWVAKFKLKDDKEDIHSPLCEKYQVEMFGFPLTNYEKSGKINLLISATISGSEENKDKFYNDLKKDKRVKFAERYKDFILMQTIHPFSREARREIKIFYNKEYILIKPVHIDKEGWEHWEVGCLDRVELNKIINAAIKYYNGKLISVKDEKIKNITNLEFSPNLSEKQFETIKLALNEGYYNYPRKLTIPELAKKMGKSYSSFQENLRRAENKIVEFFFEYR